MRFIAKLRKETKEIHDSVDIMPYLTRYKNLSSFQLLDHYRHLFQLLPIYKALEEKMKDKNSHFPLPQEFDYLLLRSEEIQRDLAFLKKFIPQNDTTVVLTSTQNYIDALNKQLIDLTADQKNSRILLGHFLARILGDLFGGQKIKTDVINLYKCKKVTTTHETDGVHFYNFEQDTLKKLLEWLNNLPLDDHEQHDIIAAANASMLSHKTIFQELEDKRPKSSIAKNCSSLFSLRNFAIAGLAVAATGLAYATHEFRR